MASLLVMAAAAGTALQTLWPTAPAPRAGIIRAALAPGSEVIVVGGGPIMLLTAKLAAMRGFKTTCAANPQDAKIGVSLIYTSECPEGSLPLSFLPIAGPEANSAQIDAAIARSSAVIFAFDNEQTVSEKVLNVFAPAGSSNVRHICIMVRTDRASLTFLFP